MAITKHGVHVEYNSGKARLVYEDENGELAFILGTDDVENDSGVPGDTSTDALNALDLLIAGLGSDDIGNDSLVPGANVSEALNDLLTAVQNIDVGFDNEFHVSKNGDTAVNGATGSLSKPFDNVQDAFDAVAAAGGLRNRVVLHPGDYVGDVTLVNDFVTFLDVGESSITGNLEWQSASISNWQSKLIIRGSGDGRPNYSGYISNGIIGNVIVRQNVTTSRYTGLSLFSTGVSGNIDFLNDGPSAAVLSAFFMAAGAVCRGDVLTSDGGKCTPNFYFYNALSSGSASWPGANGNITLHTLVNGEFTRPVITTGNAGGASGDWLNVTFKAGSDLSATTGVPTFDADAHSIASFLANVVPPAGGYNLVYRDKSVGIGNDSDVPGATVQAALSYLHSYGEMKENALGAPTTIACVLQNNWYPWVSASDGVTIGGKVAFIDDVGGDRLDIGPDGGGVYEVQLTGSHTGSVSSNFRIAVFVGAVLTDIIARSGLDATPKPESFAASGHLSLSSGDQLKVQVMCDSGAAKNFDIEVMDLNIKRIG